MSFIHFQKYLNGGVARVIFTNKAAEKMIRETPGQPPQNVVMNYAATLSAQQVLLICPTDIYDNAQMYMINTFFGCFSFRFTPEGNMLVTNYQKNSLTNQNRAISNGVYVNVTVYVEIKNRNLQIFNIIYQQHAYPTEFRQQLNSRQLQAVLTDYVTAKNTSAPTDSVSTEADVYTPHPELAELLDTAEYYARLSHDLEVQKSSHQVVYTDIDASKRERNDRIAYELTVPEADADTFKVGVMIDVTQKNGEVKTAEIVDISETEPKVFTLLFKEQVQLDDFEKNGFFRLTDSTVVLDVQLDAIDKLRTGTAPAKYLDHILGENRSSGFEYKNLDELVRELRQKKYPPNPSQVNAIVNGICSKDAYLVMGPPGTGKTTVILEWVKYFVLKEHKRVLVSSQNNKAVDNVLERIADEKGIDIIRIGSEAKLQDSVKPFMFENKIAAKREEIHSTTTGNIALAENIIRTLQTTAQSLEALSLQLQATIGHYHTLSAAREQLRQQYDTLRSLLDTYHSYEEKRAALARVVNNNAKAIDEIENGSFLKKLFGALKKVRLKKQITASVREYITLRHSEQELVKTYPTVRSAYNAQLAHCAEVFRVFFESQSAFRKELEQAPIEMPPDNIWKIGAFSIDKEQLVQQDYMRSCQGAVNAALQRAQSVLKTLKMWLDETTVQNYAFNNIVMESVDLVGATCIGINSQKKFSSLDFDVTIIDEAGQIQIHNALVPMSVSNKLIMLGDHKQIPPTADKDLVELCTENDIETDLLDKSLFEQMYVNLNSENKIMLDTQYRMPEEIARTISNWFYDGKYFSHPIKQGLKSILPSLAKTPYVIVDTSDNRKRFERKVDDLKGCCNPLEAEIVTKLVSLIAQTRPGFDWKDLGIISAYKLQVQLIKKKLSPMIDADTVREIAASLDSFQGQERDIIIYSFTRSSRKSPEKNRIGFLKELRRLNVAMSRCKKMLIMIGDMQFLAGCQNAPLDDEGNEILYQSEKEFSAFIRTMIRDVQESGDYLSYSDFERVIREAGING